MKSDKKSFLSKVIILTFIGLTGPLFLVSGQHNVDLVTQNGIPCYCQETGIWCGAASAQMILEGYPGNVNHVYPQADIWDTIQVYKDDPLINWATDPDGLKETLMRLGTGPGVNWVIHHNPDSQQLMYSVAFWMTRREYPVATLVRGFQHWIVIVNITTDVNPVGNATVNLQQIEIFDPANNPCPVATSGGTDILMTGANWFANYWYERGDYPNSKWHGNFIAVIEPPEQTGTVKVDQIVQKGRIISSEEAISSAKRALKDLQLDSLSKYAKLFKLKAMEPMLVNEENKGYYIVPFGYPESSITDGAIIINAYTGEFLELGTFRKPFTYLSPNEASRIANDYLCFCRAKTKTKLIFDYPSANNSRFHPVYEVVAEKRIFFFFKRTGKVYVNQLGKVVDILKPLPLGD